MPMVAYGLGSVNMKAEDAEIVKVTTKALNLGYHHLDNAEVYENEQGVGLALREAGIPREQLFITGKVLGLPGQDIKASLEVTLQKLGTSYLDLYLIHLPFLAADDLPSLWVQMEELKHTGKTKSIGVSNFLQKHLESILKTAKVPPAINQIEYHPNLQHGNLVEFCRKNNIAVSAYSVLIALTKPVDDQLKDAYETLGKKYNVPATDIALRWCLDQDIAVVTTSRSEKRLQDYKSTLFSFKLSPADISSISEIGAQKHVRVLYNGPFMPRACLTICALTYSTDRFDPDDRS
ncbi:NAD/NADP-dependent indole-3-acetaldehyde reductase [Paramyrothecium foliicola]|nr:NAD/NADP-dependent indole-3-acetaldehyde reductase [Paramyrothecium foliicola]